MRPRHLISTDDLSNEDVQYILQQAAQLLPMARKEVVTDMLGGAIMASLFFEPSTRTRFSFTSAMMRLGGQVISDSSMATTSSVTKGETYQDTARMVSTFADAIVVRHPELKAIEELAEGSSVPVINAGAGADTHPTQALLDLFTIIWEKESIDGLTIGLVGDLKYSRVLHSQIRLFSRYSNLKFLLVAPSKKLALPKEYEELITERGHAFKVVDSLEEALPEMDVVSMTRFQKERFGKEKVAKNFCLDAKMMKHVKEDAIVIAPLPRCDEMPPEIDDDPRCKYFDQVQYGVAVRMGILKWALGVE